MKIGDLVKLTLKTKAHKEGIIVAVNEEVKCFQVFWNNRLQWLTTKNLEVQNG